MAPQKFSARKLFWASISLSTRNEEMVSMNSLGPLGVASLCLALGISAGCKAPAETAAKAGDVTAARVASESPAGANWLLNGRTFDEGHFSPLQLINDKNVNGLGLAWYLDMDGAMGVIAEPIVVDGVIYVSAPQSRVYAVDAASGKLIWKFDPHVRLDMAINGSYSARTNAGVAVWDGKVYVGTGDCRLIAVDAAAGKQVWEATVCDPTQTGITGAPHIAKGKVLMGYNGSDDGVRGALIAYDAGTGKEVWRFWTVPGDPSKPFETKALEMAAKTWSGKDSWKIGGGDVWNAITYDETTGLVIFGTAGAGVDYGGECGYRRVRVALSDKRAGDANGKQSHFDGGPDYQRREAARGDDCAEEWIFLRAGCQDRQASFREAAGENGLGERGGFADWARSGDSKVSRRRQAVDGAQLVADELQRADRLGLHPDDRPPVRCQSGGGIWRKRRRPGRPADRVGSREPVGALVGGGADCDERRSALYRGQSGLSGARHGRVCRVCRGQWEASVVDQNGLGD